MKNLLRIFLVFIITGHLVGCSPPEEKATDHLENAQALLQADNLAKAEVEFKYARQLNPYLSEAWYGLAVISEKKQDWSAVYANLIKVRELNPKHIEGRIRLGQILLASSQLDQALLDAKEILNLAPNDARAHALMAAVHFRLENFDGALSEVERSLQIDPKNSNASLVKANVLVSQAKFDEALALVDASIKSNPTDVSAYLMKIRIHQNNGNIEAIEKTYLALIDKVPAQVSYRYALARQYLINKKIDKAETLLTGIVSDFPDDIEVKLKLVQFKIQYRAIDDAIALLKNYVQLEKNEYRFRFALGELYENGGQWENALVIYQEIITDSKLERNGLEARNKIALIEMREGNREVASKLAQEVLENDKNNESALLIKSNFQLADRKFDDAIVSLRKLLRDNPESSKALILLGKAYEASGSHELALKNYANAYRISPSTPTIANEYAGYLLRQGESKKADNVLENSISRGNKTLAALKLLAQLKISLQEWEAAEQLAKQINTVKGQEALSQQILGVIYQGQQQRDSSIEAFMRAHELSPSSGQPIMSLVQTYTRNGQFDEARKFLDSVLSVHNENITAHLLLGELSLKEQNTTEAERHFFKAIEINPKLTAGYRSLATIYLRSGDSDKAEKILNRGLAEIPDNIRLSMTLASVFEKTQRFDKSIELYETLLKENPELVVAKNNLASLLIDYKQDEISIYKALQMSSGFRDSEIPQLQDTYAWASVKAGENINYAIKILKRIVTENAEIPIYSYHLAEAYFQIGNNSRASQYLKQAIKYGGPDSETTALARNRLQVLSQ